MTEITAASDLKEKIIEQLREVYDPEIPVNIYELGLIYGLNVDEANNVDIQMTLPAPGCPVAPMIVSDVESKVGSVPEVNGVNVILVWDPPWDEDLMTDEAKLEVGIL
jgi:FeS assembly SUF system protein